MHRERVTEQQTDRTLTQMRFWKVTPRMVMGLKSSGICFPSGCGSIAVPAGGTCAGVK